MVEHSPQILASKEKLTTTFSSSGGGDGGSSSNSSGSNSRCHRGSSSRGKSGWLVRSKTHKR